jgi:hypothetical protein
LCCALLCSRAQAQDPALEVDDVQLSIPDCEGIAGDEIAKLVALELAPHRSAANEAAAREPLRASVRCAAEHATIQVEDPERASPLVLELDLSATPQPARARFVALSLAELIATSRLERTATNAGAKPQAAPAQAAAQAAQAPPPPEPASPAPAPPDARWTLFLQGGAARVFEPALLAPAVAAGAAFELLPPFAVVGDVAYERAQTSSTDANVTAQSASLSLAPAWWIRARRLTLALGLGLRAGYAHFAGSPRHGGLVGHDLSGLFLAPIAQAGAQLRLADHWGARIALELGYVVKPVRGLDADQGTLLALRGARLAALIGMTWSP